MPFLLLAPRFDRVYRGRVECAERHPAIGKLKGFAMFWKDVFAEWSEDDASRFAAALTLYTIMSLGPLLLLVVSVLGLVLGESAAQTQIVSQSHGIVGDQGAQVITGILQNAHRPGSGIPSAIVGFVILIFGLTGLVGNIQTALNTMWEIQPKRGQGIKGLLRQRGRSTLVLGGLMLLVLVVLVGSAGVTGAVGKVTQGGYLVLVKAVNILVSYVIFVLLFALIYKTVPQARVRWRDVWIGSAVTAFLFSIGREAIGIYLAHNSTSSYFGAAGALVVLIIFLYYSAQIFFVGAEFTQVWANRYGSRIRPGEHSETIPEEPKNVRDGGGAEAEKRGE